MVESQFIYNPDTGAIESQIAPDVLGNRIQDIYYEWDDLGNLTYRHNTGGITDATRGLTQHNLEETFCWL